MPQFRKHNWDQLYKEYQSSGLTKRAFAEMKGISVNMTYKKLLQIERQTTTISNREILSVEEPPAFVQVQLPEKTDVSKRSELTLEFESFSIRIDSNTDLEFLSRVIRKVMPLC